MNCFGLKGIISNEVFMIHVLNNLQKEIDVIFDSLENHVTSRSDDGLTIEIRREKLNQHYKKLRIKIN